MNRQQNEMKAVFSSMSEGVIALDMEEHVLGMNQAAAGILKCDLKSARGRDKIVVTVPKIIRPNLLILHD